MVINVSPLKEAGKLVFNLGNTGGSRLNLKSAARRFVEASVFYTISRPPAF